jgi:hypothetical protein
MQIVEEFFTVGELPQEVRWASQETSGASS